MKQEIKYPLVVLLCLNPTSLFVSDRSVSSVRSRCLSLLLRLEEQLTCIRSLSLCFFFFSSVCRHNLFASDSHLISNMPLNVTPSEKQELLVTFAALVLHDSKLPITADAITKLVAAAGGVVEPYWPKLFGQNQRRQGRTTDETVRMHERRAAQPAPPTAA